MKQEVKIITAIIVLIISFLTFNILEYELLYSLGNKYILSSFFSLGLTFALFIPKLRFKLIILSFILLFLTTFLYLAGQMGLANFLASGGIGLMALVLFSYLPEIFKKGYVEKL